MFDDVCNILGPSYVEYQYEYTKGSGPHGPDAPRP